MFPFDNAMPPGEDKPVKPQAHTDLVSFLKNYLLQHYSPAGSPAESTHSLSSKEIYEALQQVCPSYAFGIEDVATWLHDGGFCFADFGEMNFKWLMKEG